MKEITNDLLRDLELILNSNDEYFIRYDDKLNEVIACLHRDTIKIYDMYERDDRKEFFSDLIRFMKSNLETFNRFVKIS